MEGRASPRPLQSPLPIWIAVGGTPASIERAARLGLPLALAIIGGRVSNFVGHVNLYRQLGGEKLAVQMHGLVASTKQQADSRFAPGQLEVMNRIGRERGWRAMGNSEYLSMSSGDGAIITGSPEEVAERIINIHQTLGAERFMLQMGVGRVDHRHVMESIELLGSEVMPLVSSELSRA